MDVIQKNKEFLDKATWEGGMAQTVTFIVTRACQLTCKYCYVVGKNNEEKMPFEIAKQAVDYILTQRNYFSKRSAIFDFIGGEPFLEIDLIDKLCDYIRVKLYETNHPWFNAYRFSITTNGIMYQDKRVQDFINKNKTHLSIGISIDGTKKKHDLQRIYSNGKGSYDDVVKNIPLWLEQFPNASTKVTIGSDDLPYVTESVLHLCDLGIKNIMMNVVFEDIWNEGDDILFEEQLISLADIFIEKELYKTHNCSIFDSRIGVSMCSRTENKNWCGAGKMIAIDSKGNFYPCNRFAQSSLRNKPAIKIGSVQNGINTNKVRPFQVLDRCTQSSPECVKCEVANGCSWCQAENYDVADTHTIYQRSTAICKMHKARVRANNYYWNRLKVLGLNK